MGPIRGASSCLHTVRGGTVSGPLWCRKARQSLHFPRFSRHSCPKSPDSDGAAARSGDDDHFRPKPGRVRSNGVKAGQARSFLSKVRKITRQQQAGTGRSRSVKRGGPGRTANGQSVVASGRGVQRGRGASFVRARNLSNGWSHRQSGSRRVIVKSRSVRAAGRSGKAAAHLRYIQRDGTARDGEPAIINPSGR